MLDLPATDVLSGFGAVLAFALYVAETDRVPFGEFEEFLSVLVGDFLSLVPGKLKAFPGVGGLVGLSDIFEEMLLFGGMAMDVHEL